MHDDVIGHDSPGRFLSETESVLRTDLFNSAGGEMGKNSSKTLSIEGC